MMHIDWSHFTPWTALAGGLLIGAAAGLFVLFNGRIAGISGVLGGLVGGIGRPADGQRGVRLAFVASLVAAPWLHALVAPLPVSHIAASTPVLFVAGLLVGVGTRYGAGCTSGHGVCGLSRGSWRSLVATLSFMAAGFAVVAVVRHLLPG